MTSELEKAPLINHLREIVLDSNRDLPLHAQLRAALERLITDRFENGNRFYSESQLISNLSVSQGTVRRALADIAQQGLLEKRQARCTIVRKKSREASLRNLAVFLPDYSSPNVARFLSHLNDECLNRGVHMHPIYTHRGERVLRAYDNIRFEPSDGGVVLLENSPRATMELANALGDKGYECVVIDTHTRVAGLKFVGVCNASLVKTGLDHLVGLGHTRITLLVNEPEEKESVKERIAAFQSLTEQYEEPLLPRIVRSGAHLWDDAYAAAQSVMAEAMSGEQPPTAIFPISDVGALGAINWLQQHGLRVPADVSVMGSDGIELGAMMHPKLTSLVPPVQEMARAVFRLLAEKSPVDRKLTFHSTLLVRESTAPPRSKDFLQPVFLPDGEVVAVN